MFLTLASEAKDLTTEAKAKDLTSEARAKGLTSKRPSVRPHLDGETPKTESSGGETSISPHSQTIMSTSSASDPFSTSVLKKYYNIAVLTKSSCIKVTYNTNINHLSYFSIT